MPKEPESVVVPVSPPESVEFVPHANPRSVALAPPVSEIVPRSVACETPGVIASVVTVGDAV